MRLGAAAATDVGLVREGNEDSYLMEEPLFAIADGMGGHRGGEVASRIAVETVETLFRRGEGSLSEQVQEANRAVFERSAVDRAVSGMGTTITAALIQDDAAHLAHVGDSRAYLLRDGELRMLTEDHTLVHRMVQQGEITEAEARRHPQRSVITRVLGMEPSVPVDEVVVDLGPGDRLLLCSDGLTGMVDDDDVRRILERHPDPRAAADALVRAANDAGGFDNTTVIVIDVEPDEEASLRPRQDTVVAPADAVPRSEAFAAGPARRRLAGARASWLKIGAIVGVIAAVAVIGVIGLRAYLDSQWYVGVADGHVAIYQGIPADVAGFHLHHVVLETTIPAAAAEELAPWRRLADGITAEDRDRADAIVERIRKDLAAALRKPTNGAGGAGA